MAHRNAASAGVLEQRKWPRYPVPEGTIAAVHPSSILAKIEEINLCGLSFYCNDSNEIDTSGLIDIYCSEVGCFIKEIPFVIMSTVDGEMSEPTLMIEKEKRYGIRFTLFTEDQFEKLKEFIHECCRCGDSNPRKNSI